MPPHHSRGRSPAWITTPVLIICVLSHPVLVVAAVFGAPVHHGNAMWWTSVVVTAIGVTGLITTEGLGDTLRQIGRSMGSGGRPKR